MRTISPARLTAINTPLLWLAWLLCLGSQGQAQNLHGMIVVAADGTFLGTCEGTTGVNSISNPYSPYGNQYGMQSMYNPYSMYGGTYSMYSPYNSYSVSAPYIVGYTPDLYKMFTAFNYRPSQEIRDALRRTSLPRVSTNPYVGTIDPDVLRAACRNP